MESAERSNAVAHPTEVAGTDEHDDRPVESDYGAAPGEVLELAPIVRPMTAFATPIHPTTLEPDGNPDWGVLLDPDRWREPSRNSEADVADPSRRRFGGDTQMTLIRNGQGDSEIANARGETTTPTPRSHDDRMTGSRSEGHRDVPGATRPSATAPAWESQVDVSRLTDRVYREFEKRMRIERERRGR